MAVLIQMNCQEKRVFDDEINRYMLGFLLKLGASFVTCTLMSPGDERDRICCMRPYDGCIT